MNPIIDAIIEVSGDGFWNWLADEAQLDLSGMTLIGVEANRSTGGIRFQVQQAIGGEPDGQEWAKCEHGFMHEHCIEYGKGSCPWDGSMTATANGVWEDQDCYCPGPAP